MQSDPVQLLKNAGIAITTSRKKLLHFLLSSEGIKSQVDIYRDCQGIIDKITIYRTLRLFVQKNLLHIIPSSDNRIRYVVIAGLPSANPSHSYFMCNNCGHITCLENIVVPPIRLPKKFISTRIYVLIRGTCKKCKKETKSAL